MGRSVINIADFMNSPGIRSALDEGRLHIGPSAADLGKFGSVSQNPKPTTRKREHPSTVSVRPRLRLTLDFPGFPLRSEANQGGKLRDKIARKKEQKAILEAALPDTVFAFSLPTKVTMIRFGGRKMDDDNLRRAFKTVRDAIAEWLNVDDGDTAAVRFVVRQRAGYASSIRVIVG